MALFGKKKTKPEKVSKYAEYEHYLRGLQEPTLLIARAMIDRPKTFKVYKKVLEEVAQTKYKKIQWTVVDTVTKLKYIKIQVVRDSRLVERNTTPPFPMTSIEVDKLTEILFKTRRIRLEKIDEKRRQHITNLYKEYKE